MNKIIKKEVFPVFLEYLLKQYTVFGPVKKNSHYIYDRIQKADEIDYNNKTFFSAKKILIPHGEKVFTYNKDTDTFSSSVESGKTIVFLRPCDLNSIKRLDKIFLSKDIQDKHYKTKRQNLILIVLNCQTAFDNCFCQSLHTDEVSNFDLLFTDVGDAFVVETGSNLGKDLVDNFLFSKTNQKTKSKLRCGLYLIPPEINLEKLRFSDSILNEFAEKCIFCNQCAMACPTNYLMEFKDEIDFKNNITRTRVHNPFFKLEIGSENDIDKKKEYIMKWLLFQFKHFKDHHSEPLCVGCGRCIDVCPAGINIVDFINKITQNATRKE